MLHVLRDLKIYSEEMNELYDLLEISVLIGSEDKSSECLSPALDPETGQIGETDGGLLSLASVHDASVIFKKWVLGFYLLQLGMSIFLLEIIPTTHHGAIRHSEYSFVIFFI